MKKSGFRQFAVYDTRYKGEHGRLGTVMAKTPQRAMIVYARAIGWRSVPDWMAAAETTKKKQTARRRARRNLEWPKEPYGGPTWYRAKERGYYKKKPGYAAAEGREAKKRLTDWEFISRHGGQIPAWMRPPDYSKRGKKNPLLGIFGANPRARVVRELGRVVEVRYKRKDDGGLYFHKYSSKPRLLALSDGSIWIKGA